MAWTFMLTIAAYFCCYFFAALLNLYEAININHMIYCHERKMNGTPAWFLAFVDVSHFCLPFFSVVNLLFIFLPSAGYRKHCATCLGLRGWCQEPLVLFLI